LCCFIAFSCIFWPYFFNLCLKNIEKCLLRNLYLLQNWKYGIHSNLHSVVIIWTKGVTSYSRSVDTDFLFRYITIQCITVARRYRITQVGGFLRIFRFPPPIKLTHDITEILLNVALNIIKQTNPWAVVIKRVCGRHPSLHMSVSDIILRFRP
jgi:hypothetical protein